MKKITVDPTEPEVEEAQGITENDTPTENLKSVAEEASDIFDSVDNSVETHVGQAWVSLHPVEEEVNPNELSDVPVNETIEIVLGGWYIQKLIEWSSW